MATSTFTKTVASFNLTASGKKKLKEMETAVMISAENAMVVLMPKYKRLLASFSPSPTQEAQLLSEGEILEGRIVTKGKFKGDIEVSSRETGTPQGGRFLRRGGMMSVRRAIADSEVVVTGGGRGRRVSVSTARAKEINLKTGFSWQTRRRGIQGPTFPYDHKYMQALEDGGVWEVRRRTTNLLNPEPGVYAGRMIKTIQPWGMYRKARAAIRTEMAKAVQQMVERDLKARADLKG